MTKTIVLTGGGSGGHITPVLAVAAALKQHDKNLRLVYVGHKGDSLIDIPAASPQIDAVYTVRAGKFRRYHGEGWKQLSDFRTIGLNLRDALFAAIGLLQSYRLLRSLRPSVIFSRGGFVSVPVCLGGKLAGVPYITHDSDSIPSLANRLIARWASLHATALPEELYPYPPEKTRMVGIPVSAKYEPVSRALQAHYRKLLKLDRYEQVLLITGGGNGAARLNRQAAANTPFMLKANPGLVIVHIAGRSLESETAALYDKLLPGPQRSRVQVLGFVHDLYRYSGAADLIIARGGATNLAEFAIQAKACLVIPPSQLIWAIKNTEVLAERGAVKMLTEDQAEQEQRLAAVVNELLAKADRREKLADKLAGYARPDAAANLAALIMEHAR